MRTIQIYSYNDLEPAAKLKAIEEVREILMENEYHQAALWAADDCALLEPVHDEMTELLGNDYYEKNGNMRFTFNKPLKSPTTKCLRSGWVYQILWLSG